MLQTERDSDTQQVADSSPRVWQITDERPKTISLNRPFLDLPEAWQLWDRLIEGTGDWRLGEAVHLIHGNEH